MIVSTQKLLDMFIHDYLLRKNMNSTAHILNLEADLQRPPHPADYPGDGFLVDWWSALWDVYVSMAMLNSSSRQSTMTEVEAGETSVESVAQDSPSETSVESAAALDAPSESEISGVESVAQDSPSETSVESAAAQDAPSESSGGGLAAAQDAPSEAKNATQKGNDNFADLIAINQLDFKEFIKTILEGMPTAAVNELASTSEVQLLRDLAAQMMKEKAGTSNAAMGSGDKGV